MKKWIVTMLLGAVSAGWAQNPPATTSNPPATTSQTTDPNSPPQQKKQISDPAEYNSFVTALNLPDPNGRIQSLENFLQQYPGTVVKEDALTAIMQAAEQARNPQKEVDAANRLLQLNPNNVPACAVKVITDRAQNTLAALTEAGQLGQRCLGAVNSMPKPDNVSDADFAKQKEQLAAVFHAAVGMAALQSKDYPTAQQHLAAAVQANPNDLTTIYPLALSYLDAPQKNPVGLWYIARAANIAAANPQTAASAPQIQNYGHARYVKYHGDEDGWAELLASTKSSEAPPANFTVAPAPTPAEQAQKLVATKNVNQMTFDEIQLVLTSGNQQAAQTVWTGLQNKPQQFVGQIIEASKTKLMVAATADDISSNPPKADVDLTMAAPLPATLMPKVGEQIQLQGTPTSYDPNPYMIHMTEGKLLKQPGKTTKPPARGKKKGK